MKLHQQIFIVIAAGVSTGEIGGIDSSSFLL